MIEVKDLTRYYGEFAALERVSFRVEEGQIIGLLGLNGAGKSTTLKILGGQLLPSAGTVTIDGIDIVAEPEKLRSRIGYLPETPPLYDDMRVADFVRHAGRLKGMSNAQVDARLPEVLELTQLSARAQQVIGTLSHGYRKRVGIAQAIVHDPRLVILDEPISGLDPVQIVEMRKVIRNLAHGRAVLVSSHILSEVEQTCDWLIVLRGGKVAAQGTEAQLTAELHKTRLLVTVRGEADRLLAFLRAHPDVLDAQPGRASEGIAQAEVGLRADDRERLAADLIGAGFGLRGLQDSEGVLEEIFLGLAGRGEA